MRSFLIVILVGTYSLTATAQDWKAKYDKLITERAYDSAFQLLEEIDKENQNAEVVALKANLLVDNYVDCINSKMFSLKDIEDGEEVEELRGQQGQYSMYLFDIMGKIEMLLKEDLNNAELHYALANYFTFLLDVRCGELPMEEGLLQKKRFESHAIAYEAGLKNAEMLHGMGYYQMMTSNYDLAISYFIEALNMEPTHASATYNLGIAKYFKQDLDAALNYLKKAEQLYDDTYLKSDAVRTQGVIYRDKEMQEKAEERLEAAFELEPEYFSNIMVLFDQYISYGDAEKGYAMLNKKVLEDPAEPSKYRLILDIYGTIEKLDELPAYMEQLQKKLPNNDATKGNFQIHYATSLYYANRLEEALKSVDKAIVHFDLVPGIDPSAKTSAQGLKDAITKLLEEGEE